MSRFPALPENLSRVEDEIAAACRRAGRSRSEVALMAVTKQHPASAIVEAAFLGITLFGESRVQEFQEKQAQLASMGHPVSGSFAGAAASPDGPQAIHADFHLIGHLQANKSARAAEIFAAIDSLDSLRLAERLNQTALRLNRRLAVLIEVKLSPEESKTGLAPDSAELADFLERLPDLASLEVRGLMTVPPYLRDPAAVRPYFSRLRALRDRLAAAYPRLNLAELSMGMSHDFAAAVEEGSTQVRIGTALFGARPAKQPGA
jgi:PLP dependent protein